MFHKEESFWDSTKPGRPNVADKELGWAKPSLGKNDGEILRLTLRAPPWSRHGWTKDSPGFLFYFQAHHARGPRLLHGEDTYRTVSVEADGATAAKAVHCFAHRYAKEHETAKDKVVYHQGTVIEWADGTHCTLIELAWLNGLSGYAGRANWYHDKDADRSQIYQAFPDVMKAPWRSECAEIRMHDLEAKSITEFKKYLAQYSGPKLRFLDAQITQSADVTIEGRTKRDIVRYCLNYIQNERAYVEHANCNGSNNRPRNCQTFASDFFGLLVGREDIEPYSVLCRAFYKCNHAGFLAAPKSPSYESTGTAKKASAPPSIKSRFGFGRTKDNGYNTASARGALSS